MKIATRTAVRIAIQGEAGSFSHEAARRLLPGCQILPCARSAEVFDRLERGSVAAAVIPIENSLAGSVAEHFDLLLARKVFIERELRLRIVHNLIAPQESNAPTYGGILTSRGPGPMSRFFRQKSKIQPWPFYDTAGSVKHVMKADCRMPPGSQVPRQRRRTGSYPGRRHRGRQAEFHAVLPDPKVPARFARR